VLTALIVELACAGRQADSLQQYQKEAAPYTAAGKQDWQLGYIKKSAREQRNEGRCRPAGSQN
jgi:hypothetical protein